jgi:hypothetical protein
MRKDNLSCYEDKRFSRGSLLLLRRSTLKKDSFHQSTTHKALVPRLKAQENLSVLLDRLVKDQAWSIRTVEHHLTDFSIL